MNSTPHAHPSGPGREPERHSQDDPVERIQLHSLGDMVVAIPYRIGFQPETPSLVVAFVRQGRILAHAYASIIHSSAIGAAWSQSIKRMNGHAFDSVHLFAYLESDAVRCPPCRLCPCTGPRHRPGSCGCTPAGGGYWPPGPR